MQQAMNAEDESKCKSLKSAVNRIGWVGEITSTIFLIGSALMLHYRHEMVDLYLRSSAEPHIDIRTHKLLANILVCVCSASYALSLINVLVCSMLLIGIATNCGALLFPWILYHGLLFGVGLHLAIYIFITGIFEQIQLYFTILILFILVLMIFFKGFHDVFTLFKMMDYTTYRNRFLILQRTGHAPSIHDYIHDTNNNDRVNQNFDNALEDLSFA